MKERSLISRLAGAHAVLGFLVVAVAILLFLHLHTAYIHSAIQIAIRGGDQAAREAAHWRLLSGYLVFLVGGVAGHFLFMRHQLRPLQWLRSGVEAVARGDFKARVPLGRRDEIGRVAEAFNGMTEKVEQMIAARERLLGDVSHELRSPLARMKVALALLPEDDKVDALQRDVREMETLITVLLEREHLRAQTRERESVDVDLGEVARTVAEDAAGRFPGVVVEGGAQVPGTQIPGTQVRGDADLLRLLVQNLVDNALKFSLEDSAPVRVRCRRVADGVELEVLDDGRGIAAEDAERVLEPFVKLDPARGHHRGYGLGLDLCHRIVEAHGGTVRLSPRQPRGARATVFLPAGDA